MKDIALKETNAVHRTGELKMKVYNTKGVCCHWHDEYEFLIAISGNCECIIDTVKYSLQSGEGVLVFPGELHTVLKGGEQIYAIVFHPSVVCGEELKNLLSPAVSFRRKYSDRSEFDRDIITALCEIKNISSSSNVGYELLMKAYITYVIGKLYENGEYNIDEKSVLKSNVFADILKYIEDRFRDPTLTLDEVTKGVNFSRSYISRLFRENTGASFCKYLTERRLSYAKELLETTDMSVIEVAFACGFQHVSYFIQVFKDKYGSTPYKFKKEYCKRIVLSRR